MSLYELDFVFEEKAKYAVDSKEPSAFVTRVWEEPWAPKCKCR